MKRYFAAILVSCFFLQLSGCYSMQEISRDEFESLEICVLFEFTVNST
jgi:hypothetical protein